MIKNVNIGLMGHVDSGKTSIAKCLSSVGGTACFDKSPQSQSRGITLDLGFSTFKYEEKQFTIVDCPGHASLIRTVLCGAQIIDLIVLVIDATKGIQAQTAECLILAEIMTERLIFVINKIDLWPEGSERDSKFEIVKKKLRTAMKDGKFASSPIVPFSASLNLNSEVLKMEINKLINEIPINRNVSDSFVFAVDHCFPIKGQGSVLTGTVLQGQISINESIEIPFLKATRKIKSMQSFRESVKTISAGDRAGICVQSIETDGIERTLICNSLSKLRFKSVLLLEARRIKHFKGELKSKSKIHISILNESVLCKQIVIVKPTIYGYEYVEKAEDERFHVLIELEKPICVLPDSIVIGSKLDLDPSLQKCRIAFYGRFKDSHDKMDDFRIYKVKNRFSLIDRIVSETRLIGKQLTSDNDTKLSVSKYLGLNCEILGSSNDNLIATGSIESLFGSSGKFNVSLKGANLNLSDWKGLRIRITFGKVLNKEEIFSITKM